VHALTPTLPEALRFNVAAAAGFAVSCFGNFLLNDLWTWGDREKRGRAHFFQRLGTYYVVSLSGYGVQAGTGNLLIGFTEIPHWGANLIGIGLGTVFNFVLNNLLTFRAARS
jgi:dolichol-phosphate mannosyltransferase